MSEVVNLLPLSSIVLYGMSKKSETWAGYLKCFTNAHKKRRLPNQSQMKLLRESQMPSDIAHFNDIFWINPGLSIVN